MYNIIIPDAYSAGSIFYSDLNITCLSKRNVCSRFSCTEALLYQSKAKANGANKE